jgi:secretion/DNA translocation related TadE-like protein
VVPPPRPGDAGAGADDRGSATFAVLAAIVLVGVLGAAACALAGLAALKHRAAAAADLAALAAARTLEPDAGCAAARATARRNGATLQSCSWDGRAVSVRVAVVVETAFGLRPTLRARSRAGPAP